MAEWVLCTACKLRHGLRADGLCPRCRAPSLGIAPAAVAAPGPGPQPGASASTDDVPVLSELPPEEGYAEAIAELQAPPRRSRLAWLGALSGIAFIALMAWKSSLTIALLITAVLLLHELGHWVAMRLAGQSDARIFFLPFLGAVTTASQRSPRASTRVLISLAGPLPGILLGALLLLAFPDKGLGRAAAVTLLYVNVLNLLPVGFLDGGRVVSTLFLARAPVLEVAFQVVSVIPMVALLSGATGSAGSGVVGGLAAGMLVGAFRSYRIGAAARALGQLPLNGGDLMALPEPTLRALHRAARRLLAKEKAKATSRPQALLMREIFGRCSTPRASPREQLAYGVTWVAALALGGTLLIGKGAGLGFGTTPDRVVPAADRVAQPAAEAERERREAPVAEIAPASISSGTAPSVLSGEVGSDEYGNPRQHVDRAALRGLLFRRRFAELTLAVESLQEGFEADPRKEDWPNDAAEALGTGETTLLPLLEEWANASPGSFAPPMALGSHWVAAAYERRGTKFAAETPPQDFEAMGEALRRAMPELAKAVERRPRLVSAMRQQLRARLLDGGPGDREQVLTQALTVCPSCFLIRVTFLRTITPRWGGSDGKMSEFATRPWASPDRHAALLSGYVELERARELVSGGRDGQALVAAERACAAGTHWEFLAERGRIKLRVKDVPGALADLELAGSLRPGHPDVLFWHSLALGRAGRWEEAGGSFRAGAQVDPGHWLGRSIAAQIVEGLVYEGWNRHQAGDRDGALRDYDLAAEFDPGNPDVQSRRNAVIVGGEAPTAARGPAGAEWPTDEFRTVQRHTYQLARQGQIEQVIPLWDDFLARQADHGRAHLERGKALYHLGRHGEAADEARKACELGVSEGCAQARKLGVSL
jgi:tetratricopeptide (TPR) repeat protein/Zn-dependent protease